MGRKPQTQTVYLPTPTPTAPPQQTAEQASFVAQMQKQMEAMSQQYQTQVGNLRNQFDQNQAGSTSLLTQLQEQLRNQQALSSQAASELAKARETSNAQTALLDNARQASQAQDGDARQQQLTQTDSLFGRLQRRQTQRKTTY